MAVKYFNIIILILKNHHDLFYIIVIIHFPIYRQSIIFCALDMVGLMIVTKGEMIVK